MKHTDFKYCGLACGIYLVKNLINNHVYIGQTKGLFINRWNAHIYTANSTVSKNKNLLSAAITKYGIDCFDFSVLETCEVDQLDEREQYWIKIFNADSHDNYNQTAGGQNQNLRINITDDILHIIELLQNTNKSINEISKVTSKSVSAIYDINLGNRWHQDDISYPIRNIAQKVVVARRELINQIAGDLINTSLSFKQISAKYNVSLSYIKRVNSGRDNLVLEDQKYPLRQYQEADCSYINDLVLDLQNTNLSFDELASKYNISTSLIYFINRGTRHKIDGLVYPLRPTNKSTKKY